MPRSEPDGELEVLLSYLKDARGFDFTGYKRASLSRRIQHRIQAVGADDYASYMSVLEANPAEFAQLFDTILINVTAFMRDPEAWEYLAAEVIPTIVADRPDEPLRIWSAGTASGQEAYSLAVLFAEAWSIAAGSWWPSIATPALSLDSVSTPLGEERFRQVVKIYAPASAGRARSIVRRFLEDVHSTPQTHEAAVLVVSELVSNAVLHTTPSAVPIHIRVEASQAGVHIEVVDHAPDLPRPDTCFEPNQEHGRGLVIVERMSSRWGWAPIGGNGKAVWCDIADQNDVSY